MKEFDTVNSSSITTDIATVFTTFWSANTGVELNLDYVKSTRFQYNTPIDIVSRRGLYPNGARYHSFAAYNLHHFTLKQLQIETGVRFHKNKITIQDASIGAILIKPSAWVYMLGTSYAISEQLTLFGNINSAFEHPILMIWVR